jgi:NAD(P)-dependent dehydrogenase (short-subunit alcohol dehydrogenase family)
VNGSPLSMFDLTGRAAIVTGASSGLGLGFARTLAGAGATVYAAARRLDRLEILAKEHDRIVPVRCDITEADERQSLVDRVVADHGGVDVLVNNAGLMRQRAVLEITVADWDELFAVNLRAVFFLTQAVAAGMAERGAGAVVSVASVNAFRTEAPEAHYNATKAGIVSVMRSFATELSHRGETVGPEEAAGYTDADRARTREYLQRVPLRRVGLPVEIARVVCFLASDEASYVNGQTIVADGGELSGDWYDTASRPPVPERLAGIERE